MSEQVNHPSHYQADNRKECIEEMRDIWGDGAVRLWCNMTAYKYNYRAGLKEGNSKEQDLAKARWYLNYSAMLDDEMRGRTNATIV